MQQSRSWYLDILFLIVILGSLYFILLGSRPLFVPDEGRYAEISREMIVNKDFITPYLNHIKYFEKPILFYWLGSLSIKIGGLSLWSLRSVNALLALFGALFTYFAVRKLYDRTSGLLAALILGTSTLYVVMAHMISLDLPVSVFLSLTLYAFLLGIFAVTPVKKRFYFYSATAFAALAVLSKGLIGIVFPVLIIMTWLIILREKRYLKNLYLPSCLLIFLLIVTPWHLLVSHRNPEFFYFYFIEQHFLRYTKLNIGHYQPVWFFIPILFLGFFPWIIFLPQTLAQSVKQVFSNPRHYPKELFFLCWAILIFIFFSFSKSKLIPYILPVIPPLAVLTARYLVSVAKEKSYAVVVSYAALGLCGIVMFLTFYFFTTHAQLPHPYHAQMYLILASLVFITGTLFSFLCSYNYFYRALGIVVMSTSLTFLCILAALPAIDTRSVLPLARIIKTQINPRDEVITFNQYYQDLPFYLERRISILNWRNEFTYGMKHQDTHAWMINNNVFWQRFHSSQRVFVILSMSNYNDLQKKFPQEKFYVLGKTVTNILISNQR